MSLPIVPQDKANHAIYGYAVSTIVGGLLRAAGEPYWREGGMAAAGLAGAMKEGLDWWLNRRAGIPIHGVEWGDFLATLGGGVAAMLSAYD